MEYYGAYSFIEGVCVIMVRSSKGILALGLLLLCTSLASGHDWKMVHGDVLQVFPEQHKILLDCSGERMIYELEEDCLIWRLGAPASLASMRPVYPGAFQDALCWVNPCGRLSHVLVSYSVHEEDGLLVAYDIFGNLE